MCAYEVYVCETVWVIFPPECPVLTASLPVTHSGQKVFIIPYTSCVSGWMNVTE